MTVALISPQFAPVSSRTAPGAHDAGTDPGPSFAAVLADLALPASPAAADYIDPTRPPSRGQAPVSDGRTDLAASDESISMDLAVPDPAIGTETATHDGGTNPAPPAMAARNALAASPALLVPDASPTPASAGQRHADRAAVPLPASRGATPAERIRAADPTPAGVALAVEPECQGAAASPASDQHIEELPSALSASGSPQPKPSTPVLVVDPAHAPSAIVIYDTVPEPKSDAPDTADLVDVRPLDPSGVPPSADDGAGGCVMPDDTAQMVPASRSPATLSDPLDDAVATARAIEPQSGPNPITSHVPQTGSSGRDPAQAPIVADTAPTDRAAKVAFNAAPGVGQNAVAFDARPLVGPAAIAGEAGAPASLPTTALPPAFGGPSAAMARPAPEWVPPLAAPANACDSVPVAGPSRDLTLVKRRLPAPIDPHQLAAADGRPTSWGAAPRRDPNPPPVEAASLSAAAPSQAARTAASLLPRIAALKITPHEILVTLRGVELSEAERTALTEQVRDLVAQTHPGTRPVRIVPSSRSA